VGCKFLSWCHSPYHVEQFDGIPQDWISYLSSLRSMPIGDSFPDKTHYLKDDCLKPPLVVERAKKNLIHGRTHL
jgi:hypothetical protein